MREVTQILEAVGAGDGQAAEKLLPLVYDELRRLAAAKMAGEAPGQTLQPTALVHEAWHRLAGSKPVQWNGRAHFFGATAEAMRRILLERARRKGRIRHGGQYERVDLEQVTLATRDKDGVILAVDEALEKLAEIGPQKAEVDTLGRRLAPSGIGDETGLRRTA